MNNDAARLYALDGLRGLAAFWVLAGHSLNLSGAWLPIIGRPLLAVDLFMMLSGALMVYQSDIRARREPMTEVRNWLRFWVRRFFRIAPLFYVILLVVLVLGPEIGAARAAIAESRGIGFEPERYLDRSFTNIALHVTFLFGFFPEYAVRTAIPDWSIGLEMQFYLFFPLILLLLARIGLVLGSVLLIIATGLFAAAYPGFLASFPEPAFLGLKLQLFLAGMLIMRARIDQNPRLLLPAIILAVIPIGSLPHWSEYVVRVLLALVLIVALSDKSPRPSLRAANAMMERTLGGRTGRFLGDISYGVYLIHLPVLIVILSLLLGLPPFPRAIAGFALAVLPVALLAWLGFRLVEKPGIDLGRKLLSGGPRQVPSAPPMT